MMVNELRNALRRMAVARDYRTTRMTLFVYFWNGVKTPWPKYGKPNVAIFNIAIFIQFNPYPFNLIFKFIQFNPRSFNSFL